MQEKFSCRGCGACCSQLHLFGSPYAHLDNGEGVCRYYDDATHSCCVYAIRPMICRIEEGYYMYFSHMSYSKYLQDMQVGCNLLRANSVTKETAKCPGKYLWQGGVILIPLVSLLYAFPHLPLSAQ